MAKKIWFTQHCKHYFVPHTPGYTDFVTVFDPLKSAGGKLVEFKVPGKQKEVICSAAGLNSLGVDAPAKFSLCLLDSEGEPIKDLRVIETDLIRNLTAEQVANNIHSRKHVWKSYLSEWVDFSFVEGLMLQSGEVLEWRTPPLSRSSDFKDVEKVVFKGMFGIWVKEGTDFGWWDYNKGCMKTICPK